MIIFNVRGLFFFSLAMILGILTGVNFAFPGLTGLATGIFVLTGVCGLGAAFTDRCGARWFVGYLARSVISAMTFGGDEDKRPEERIATFCAPLGLAPWIAAGWSACIPYFDHSQDASLCYNAAAYYTALGVAITTISIATHRRRRIDREKMIESIDMLLKHYAKPQTHPYPEEIHPRSMRLATSSDKTTIIVDWLDEWPTVISSIIMTGFGVAMLILYT
jgi:hypothetical protein